MDCNVSFSIFTRKLENILDIWLSRGSKRRYNVRKSTIGIRYAKMLVGVAAEVEIEGDKLKEDERQ